MIGFKQILERDTFLDKISTKKESSRKRIVSEYNSFSKYIENINNIDKEDLKEYVFSRIENTSYWKMSQQKSILKDFFKILNLNVPVDEYIEEFVELKKSDVCDIKRTYITKDDIYNLNFINPSDKFIILFYFLGISDQKDIGLRELTIKDIDFINKKMNIKSQTINIDDDFLNVILETLSADIYVGNLNGQPKRCSLNKNSLYILKSKRTDLTKDGTTPLSYNALRFRLQNINAQLGTNFSKTSLKVSGVADTLYNLNSEDGYWTIPEIRRWKKENNKTFSETDVYYVLEKLYYESV